MKILIIGAEDRYARHMPEDIPVTGTIEKIFLPRGASDEEIIAAGKDCEFLAADPMTKVSRAAIEGLPHLKMIHSEGVGFNGFDVEAAREAGIYVCNCRTDHSVDPGLPSADNRGRPERTDRGTDADEGSHDGKRAEGGV